MSRIHCINPACRRTAKADADGDGQIIICRACWRLLPERMQKRFKQLNRRTRALDRKMEKRFAQGTLPPYRIHVLIRLQERGWADLIETIKHFFDAPDRPAGIEAFLEEVGL